MKDWKYINGAEVGNEAKVTPVDPSPKTGSKPNPDNNQNPKKNPKEEMTDKNGRTFREVLEEVKKTGNKYNIKPMSYKADAYRYGKELAEQDFKNFKYSNTSTLESIYRNNTSGEDYEQYGFLDFKKGYYDTYQQMDKKVGNSTEKLFYGLSKDAKKEEEKSDEALDGLKKTGNETYQHKLYPDKYVIIEGKNYKIVTDGKVEKSGELTDAVLYGINQTYKRVGNASIGGVNLQSGATDQLKKTGNTKVKKTLFKSLSTPTTWTPGINGRPIAGAPEFKGTFAKDEAEKWTDKWIKDHGFEVENKVVTDPAQAKAIAYSESKKTENGLARARNAIKKNS